MAFGFAHAKPENHGLHATGEWAYNYSMTNQPNDNPTPSEDAYRSEDSEPTVRSTPAADSAEQSGTSEPASGAGETPKAENKTKVYLYGMLCHLLGLAGYLFPFGGNIIGPLVVWLIKKDEDAFADRCGREALNFQISVAIYGILAFLLTFIAIGFLLLIALVIFQLVAVIIATVKAADGEEYRYPLTIRFIK